MERRRTCLLRRGHYQGYSPELSLISQIGACPDYCDIYTLDQLIRRRCLCWVVQRIFILIDDESNPFGTKWVGGSFARRWSLAKCSAWMAGWLLGWEYLHNERAIDAWADEWSNGGLYYRDLGVQLSWWVLLEGTVIVAFLAGCQTQTPTQDKRIIWAGCCRAFIGPRSLGTFWFADLRTWRRIALVSEDNIGDADLESSEAEDGRI